MLRITLLAIACFSMVSAAADEPFVPDDFDVPAILETDRLRLRMLTVNDVVKDYDAVVSSTGNLFKRFPLANRPDFGAKPNRLGLAPEGVSEADFVCVHRGEPQ